MASTKKAASGKAKKSRVQVRDMKPRKDAKGGMAGKHSSLASRSKVGTLASKINIGAAKF